ncbi:hypothetical protein PLICRDRAFT_516928 [Plicaturopsis crispa FD-325 SS-3]|nr:hypothetical protein PLICRDRAFT_516928 [Plicaturopsis crispa FD-325 SS-3]
MFPENYTAGLKLISRSCIEARAYFTERFFGNDMDFGHKAFWELLVQRRAATEELLVAVEKRAYELILGAQNALWVLERQQRDTEVRKDCTGHVDTPRKRNNVDARMPPPPVEDPIDVALREKCTLLWEKIRTRLAKYCAPAQSRFPDERVKVIMACVRRAIYTDPALMLLAQGYKDVMSLLKDSSLDVSTVSKLWLAIQGLSVYDIRAAIDDVLRPKSSKGDYVKVLGGKIYKDQSDMEWPLHAWGHLTAVYKCYSCARRVCNTVEDIVMLTRFAIFTGSRLAHSHLRYESSIEGSWVFMICGFIPNDLSPAPPRYSVSKCNCPFRANTAHWQESRENPVLCAGLSLKDPKSQAFVNACLRHPDFQVMTRKGATGRIICSHKTIVASRIRHANTRAGLQKVPWAEADHTIPYLDTLINEARPLRTHGDGIEDCFQVAIVDDGEGDLSDFGRKLAEVWLQVYGVEDNDDLFTVVAGPFIVSGDLELGPPRNGQPVIAQNVEPDVGKSYKRLWGVPLPEKWTAVDP